MTAGSGPSSNLSFNTNNQPIGYTYDSSGNMTVEPLAPWNYMTYDGENRMTAFQGIGGAASYSYDGNGMRVVKSLQGGTTTVSIFSGSSVIAEYDNGAAPSSPSREYIHNPAGGATTGLLAMISAGATTYYHQDHLSARLTTDASGNILTQEGHFPFGEQWYQSGSGNKWLFTSYQRDSESGLDYALARYYDSHTGTFCSADPLAGSPDDPQSWNRYAYGRNDPIDVTDPSGKFFFLIPLMELLAQAAQAANVAEGAVMIGALHVTETVAVHATITSIATETAEVSAEIAPAAAMAAEPHSGGPQQKPPSNQQAQQTPKKDCPPKFANFFKQAPIFNNLAKQLNTKPLFLMAQSSMESAWLGPHAQGLHNLFGMTHAGGNDISYSSFQASSNSYYNAYSQYVSNTQTMDQFVAGLQKVPPHGYNTVNPNYYKNLTDQQKWVKQHAADCGVSIN